MPLVLHRPLRWSMTKELVATRFGRLAVMLLVTTSCIVANAQSTQHLLLPVCRDGKWGYIDSAGTVVIAPEYHIAHDFHEGLARVRNGRDLSFIASSGQVSFSAPPKVVIAGDFSMGLAWFKTAEDRFGYVDRDGRIVIKAEYADASDFNEGSAAVCIFEDGMPGRWGFINADGSWLLRPQFSYANGFHEGVAIVSYDDRPFQFIDTRGERVFEITPPMGWDITTASEFVEGTAKILYWDGKKSRIGFVDHTGRTHMVPAHSSYKRFSEGIATGVTSGGQLHAVDRAWKEVFKIPFDGVGRFSEGLCRVKDGDQCAYIGRNGTVQIRHVHATSAGEYGPRKPSAFNDCTEFHDGIARVHIGGTFQLIHDAPSSWEGGAWYYINRSGEVISMCRKDSDYGAPHGRQF